MPKPVASLASLLPHLWHRPSPPPPRLLRALSSSSSPLLTTRHIPRGRFRSSPTTHLGASATAVTTAADPVEAPTATLYPAYDRLLPCPSQDYPPRIEHLVAREDEVACDFISRSLSLPPLYVADLIKFGAVYYALVPPQPPPYADPAHVRIFREVTEPSLLRRRASIKGKTVREAQKTFRVTDPGQHLEAGTYLRVHVHPKRFPRNYEIDWKSRVVAITDSYVVLNKPAATAVGGSTDNIEESCVVFTSRALGLESPLMTTHQIDNCSEGCVVLSKTKEFCSVFHGLIRERQVKKLYLALTAEPVSPGIITHYMRPLNRAPRLVSEDHIGGWYLCQMEILECKKVPWPKSLITKVHKVDNCGWPKQEAAYECKINLMTGKTHQIRAQLAAMGAPIVGDTAYMAGAIATKANPSINPYGRASLTYSSDEEKAAAVEAWVACHGKEPKSVIGLQASEISWDCEGERHYHKAGVPWWRQDAVESDLVHNELDRLQGYRHPPVEKRIHGLLRLPKKNMPNKLIRFLDRQARRHQQEP